MSASLPILNGSWPLLTRNLAAGPRYFNPCNDRRLRVVPVITRTSGHWGGSQLGGQRACATAECLVEKESGSALMATSLLSSDWAIAPSRQGRRDNSAPLSAAPLTGYPFGGQFLVSAALEYWPTLTLGESHGFRRRYCADRSERSRQRRRLWNLTSWLANCSKPRVAVASGLIGAFRRSGLSVAA